MKEVIYLYICIKQQDGTLQCQEVKLFQEREFWVITSFVPRNGCRRFCYNAAKSYINSIREGFVVTVKQQLTRESVEYLLTRGVAQIEKEEDLRRLLLEGNKGEPLRVKLGIEASLNAPMPDTPFGVFRM